MRILLWVLLPLAVGCAHPRVITDITTSGDQAKFIYNRLNSGENGVIQCDVDAEGNLTACRDIPITWLKKGE
ncbi:MAG: hypothetical protein KC912_25350 [Proteobacteria bacterium]|nr:hypothetical protein [Pseudomonadota bacterium]